MHASILPISLALLSGCSLPTLGLTGSISHNAEAGTTRTERVRYEGRVGLGWSLAGRRAAAATPTETHRPPTAPGAPCSGGDLCRWEAARRRAALAAFGVAP